MNENKGQNPDGKPIVEPETRDKVSEATESVKAAGEESAEAAGEAAAALRDGLRESADESREGLKDSARSTLGAATEAAERQAERRKNEAADYAGRTADDLRTAADDVDNEWIAAALGQGASGIGRIAEALRGKSVEEIVDDTRRFARDHPATFLTGCFAIGVGLNRALRVTKHQSRYTDRQGEFFADEREERTGRRYQPVEPTPASSYQPGTSSH